MLDIPDIVVSMSLAKPALFPASQEKTRAEKPVISYIPVLWCPVLLSAIYIYNNNNYLKFKMLS